MKIIHCSDVHLDSAMNTHLTPEKAQNRKRELLLTFVRMVEYAKENGVRVILIAGDLFDTQEISDSTKDELTAVIKEHAQIDFLYLCGNHDEELFVRELEKLDNVKLFPGIGKSYRYGNVVITGLNRMDITEKLRLKEQDINIVMLHGQLENAREYAGRNIDYMAMGHIHKYSRGRLDARGEYCYCGCLEARGFDECGKKGFVLIETNSDHKVSAQFVPFAKRTAYEIVIDVSRIASAPELLNEIKVKACECAGQKDMLRVRIAGTKPDNAEWDLEHIQAILEDMYYIVNIKDETRAEESAEYTDFEKHFVRIVEQSREDDVRKREIIAYGLKALRGRLD
ncbi:MAG: metallophosphoesterase [Lachnospira sp.]|nr:metallophosphoesterase [Lachnospira sp.]